MRHRQPPHPGPRCATPGAVAGASRFVYEYRRRRITRPLDATITGGAMDALSAFALAVLQGVTELFPISSLGHAVIVPALFGWAVDQHSPAFLPFIVVLHVGTAVALLVYFWRDWLLIAQGLVGRGGKDGTSGRE